MTRGYKFAVMWIAINDSGADKDATAEEIAGYVSTALVADIYDKDQDKVGRDVRAARQRLKLEADKRPDLDILGND